MAGGYMFTLDLEDEDMTTSTVVDTRVDLNTDIALALAYLDQNYLARIASKAEPLRIGVFRSEWGRLPTEMLKRGDVDIMRRTWTSARGDIAFVTPDDRGQRFDVIVALEHGVDLGALKSALVGPAVLVARG